MSHRLGSEVRRALIIEAAHGLADESGNLLDITHEAAAENCAVPTSVATVRRYFLTIGELRAAVAIRDRRFVAQAIKIGVMS